MDCVRPGVELVRAKPFTPSRLFIKLDFPTFDLPRKATSGLLSFGKDVGTVAAAINLALVIFMRQLESGNGTFRDAGNRRGLLPDRRGQFQIIGAR